MGTTHPISSSSVVFLRMTWLPRCRTCWKPSRSSTRITCRPESLGSLGINSLEGCHPRAARWPDRKLFEIQLSCFFEIGKGFLDGRTLTDGPNLRAVCNIETVFLVDDCSKCICHTSSRSWLMTRSITSRASGRNCSMHDSTKRLDPVYAQDRAASLHVSVSTRP